MLAATVKWFSWQLPRFEAGEFAAGFCAACKAGNVGMLDLAGNKMTPQEEFELNEQNYGEYSHGGGVRLMPQGDPDEVARMHCSDIEYRYVIKLRFKQLHVTCYQVSYWEEDSAILQLYSGSLVAFTAWANRKEKETAE